MNFSNTDKNKTKENLINLLDKKGWRVNTEEESTIISMEKDGTYYMLNLFFGDEMKAENYHNIFQAGAWLAADESCNPFSSWTSQMGLIDSPIRVLREHLQTHKRGRVYTPIVVLMEGQYLRNARDERYNESWGQTIVLSEKRLRLLLENDEMQPVCGDFRDLGVPDNGLRQEIYDEPIKSTSASFIMHIEAGTEFYAGQSLFPAQSSSGAFLVSVLLGDALPQKGRYYIELQDSQAQCLSRVKVKASEAKFLHKLSFKSLPAGEYRCRLLSKVGRLIDWRPIYVFEEDEIEDDRFRFESMSLIGLNSFMLKFHEENLCYSQNVFDGSILESILCRMTLSNQRPDRQIFRFKIVVSNEGGKCVYTKTEDGCLTGPASLTLLADFKDVIWEKGEYTVDLYYFDRLEVSSTFNVSDKEAQQEYTREDVAIVRHARPRRKSNKQNYRYKFTEEGVSVLDAETGEKIDVILGVDTQDDTEKLCFELSQSESMQRLQSLIGLTEIKKIVTAMTAMIQHKRDRQAEGLPAVPAPLHLAFLGNPGTGKTTVAKIIGQLYKEIGLLKSGHVCERNRASLTNTLWGSETELTKEAIEESEEGVLFIDEAYDLITEHPTDPGKLIVSTLLPKMADEDCRNWVVILAGYSAAMEAFLSKNPGLDSRVTRIYFPDYEKDELMQIADAWMLQHQYHMTDEARAQLLICLTKAWAQKGDEFGNARYIDTLMNNEILPAMALRLQQKAGKVNRADLMRIEAEDIPHDQQELKNLSSLFSLDDMVGLKGLKDQIEKHLSFVNLIHLRRTYNLYTPMPPMHMVFAGNPGTGKTCMAERLGKIYASMGILSQGQVIKVARSDVMDTLVGGLEKKMRNILRTARGNILFIDEAYTFAKKKNDNDNAYRAIEMLLEVMAQRDCDMIVILAGYSADMKSLLDGNIGLKGRFSHHFEFPDYSPEELWEIALIEAKRYELSFTPAAERAVKAAIKKECAFKDASFSNARFIERLISTQIMPHIAQRLNLCHADASTLTKADFCTVEEQDVPIEACEVARVLENAFDEEALHQALEKLDSMVALTHVKNAIHQFVAFVRARHQDPKVKLDSYPLEWHFVGGYGLGKSSVAKILAKILKALGLLRTDKKLDMGRAELDGGIDLNFNKLAKQKLEQCGNGLLFMDADIPVTQKETIKSPLSVLNGLAASRSLVSKGRCAVVMAHNDLPSMELCLSLARIGLYDFDHTLIFEDYSASELLEILHLCLAKLDYVLSDEANTVMIRYIEELRGNQDASYANARTMKLLSFTLEKAAIAAGVSDGVIPVDLVQAFSHARPGLGRSMVFHSI